MSAVCSEYEDSSNRKEYKEKRTSFISILCKLQRGILIFGGVMLVIWFSITYGFQNYSNSSETVIAMRRTSQYHGEMGDYMEQIITTGRLTSNVIPHHYNLTLQLFMPPEYNFTTTGKVNILIECLKKTKVSYFELFCNKLSYIFQCLCMKIVLIKIYHLHTF